MHTSKLWFIPSLLVVDRCFFVLAVKCVFLTDQLERVFLRLGHAETDDQLQDIISKFLPPVLLKLSSVQEGVRKKVSRMFYASALKDVRITLY